VTIDLPKSNPLPGAMVWLPVLFVMMLSAGTVCKTAAADLADLGSFIGPKDSILVAGPRGKILLAKHEDQPRVPASILKLFTSLVALHELGRDYRFTTEFYLDSRSNLKIKGYGDPLLISEIVAEISQSLAVGLNPSPPINDLVVDDSYFTQPLTIPGITSSPEPYDAPNGALCVNFNTVFFKYTAAGYASAEPQTPLLPFALKKIKASGLNQGRIVLSHAENDISIYAGKLFQYFLEKNGLTFLGTVKTDKVQPQTDRLIYRYVSKFNLEQIISKLLEYSNNFTINQLLISCGARVYGPPGTLEKGMAAARKYAAGVLDIHDMTLAEGSGISRKNKVSARRMDKILTAFAPFRHLMRREGNEFYKTGTLDGINTRAGYIQSQNDKWYRYVVMINTSGKSTEPVMQKLRQAIKE
jgi:D-alanyl-D-alanine carboxypeptidase/D-alanyl-D-alanine-endopeptidase (penicillin-binding protein 4)